jgi:tetratricopeptide (TPR) repeat protein
VRGLWRTRVQSRPVPRDWYRGPDWDAQSFEQRLARARPQNRPQYLRIKAVELLEAGGIERRRVAIDLLTRLYAMSDEAEYGTTPEFLGNAYEADGQHDRAAQLYLEAIERQRASFAKGRPALALANMALRQEMSEYYQAAFTVLANLEFEVAPFDADRFDHAGSLALLADRLGNSALTAKYAEHALDLAATRTKPEYPRHPDVGLIDVDDETLAALRRLLAST